MNVSGTQAAINPALTAGVVYQPNNGFTGSDTLQLLAENSQTGEVGTATIGVTVTSAPPPVISAPTTATVVEDSSLTFSTAKGNAISVVYAAAGARPDSFSIGASDGTITLKSITGLTFINGTKNGGSGVNVSGTSAAINAALGEGVVYQPNNGFTGSDKLQLLAENGLNAEDGNGHGPHRGHHRPSHGQRSSPATCVANGSGVFLEKSERPHRRCGRRRSRQQRRLADADGLQRHARDAQHREFDRHRTRHKYDHGQRTPTKFESGSQRPHVLTERRILRPHGLAEGYAHRPGRQSLRVEIGHHLHHQMDDPDGGVLVVGTTVESSWARHVTAASQWRPDGSGGERKRCRRRGDLYVVRSHARQWEFCKWNVDAIGLHESIATVLLVGRAAKRRRVRFRRRICQRWSLQQRQWHAVQQFRGDVRSPSATNPAGQWTQVASDPVVYPANTLLGQTQPLSMGGDQPSEVLPNGSVLIGNFANTGTEIYVPQFNANGTPGQGSWKTGPSKNFTDGHEGSDEESWVKLGNGDILTYDNFSSYSDSQGEAELYVPSTTGGIGKWVPATNGNLPILTTQNNGFELGPALLLPNGDAFFSGPLGLTALYNPSTGQWSQGPTLPQVLVFNQNGLTYVQLGMDDGPGAVLPNGDLLLASSPTVTTSTQVPPGPTFILEYNPTTNVLENVSPSSSLIGQSE